MIDRKFMASHDFAVNGGFQAGVTTFAPMQNSHIIPTMAQPHGLPPSGDGGRGLGGIPPAPMTA
jgi:hypothetical protein